MNDDSRKKVMVVDDDPEFLEELSSTLVLNEYDVVTVEHPQEVVERVHQTSPDVILLDLNMPARSGFQVACDLNFFANLSRIPIIAMTGFFQDKPCAVWNKYGIADCLRKPFDPLLLIMKIESLV